MRRVVVELYGTELEKRVSASPYKDIESMELLHILHYDQKELAGIWRMTSNDASLDVEDKLKRDSATIEARLLERDKEGSLVVFMRRTLTPGLLYAHDNVMSGGGYLFGPLDYKKGRLKTTFVGSQGYVRKVLREVEARGIEYKVLSASDADFASDSLLNGLTKRQRDILFLAFELGYYHQPKRVNSEELAIRLNLKRSTVVEHLRKAESRLLSQIFAEPNRR
jgi:predicted DNA binding protein